MVTKKQREAAKKYVAAAAAAPANEGIGFIVHHKEDKFPNDCDVCGWGGKNMFEIFAKHPGAPLYVCPDHARELELIW